MSLRRHAGLFRWALFIATFIALVLLAVVLYVLHRPTIESSAIPLTANTSMRVVHTRPNPALPVRLKIPKLNIDAPLDYVGLTTQGALAAPKTPTSAGWYKTGPRPGETGNAVIDGHFGWKDNIPAVFDNLHLLQAGDILYTQDNQGITTTFIVRALQMYTDNESVPNVFRSTDGNAHLNLITCQGTWNKNKKSYSNRLVVFADQEKVD